MVWIIIVISIEPEKENKKCDFQQNPDVIVLKYAEAAAFMTHIYVSICFYTQNLST